MGQNLIAPALEDLSCFTFLGKLQKAEEHVELTAIITIAMQETLKSFSELSEVISALFFSEPITYFCYG